MSIPRTNQPIVPIPTTPYLPQPETTTQKFHNKGGIKRRLQRKRETLSLLSLFRQQGVREGEIRKGITDKQNSNQKAVSPPWPNRLRGGGIADERGADEKFSHEVSEMNGQRIA
ncbi:hypothetical protein TNCV_1545211 [Trichonephila clavipes]|nr:hypothetical protein TNCV_1545211 [Trichonephila clavipes]